MIPWIALGLLGAWVLWGRSRRQDATGGDVHADPAAISRRVYGVGSHPDLARDINPQQYGRIAAAIDRARAGGADIGLDGEISPEPGMGLPDYL